MRTIEHVHQLSLTSGRQFPSHLVVQSDNTVAQAKNQHAFLLLAFFVARYKFVTANIFFLMVGHTHEDVDQMFGVVLELVLKRHRFETPEAFLVLLQQPLADRCLAKGEKLITETLDCIRDFKQWLAPTGCSMAGSFANRSGIEAPHAFSFKLRRDCTRADFNDTVRKGRVMPGNPCDVMICVKTYMRDTQLQDVPDVAMTPANAAAVVQPSPSEVKPVHPLTEKQIDDYLNIAHMCRKDFNLPAAAERLNILVNVRRYQMPASPWLERSEVARPGSLELGESLFPHLPRASWKLVCKVGSH